MVRHYFNLVRHNYIQCGYRAAVTRSEFRFNGIEGTVPASWTNITQLEQLWFSNNKMSGTLPESWSVWKNLEELHMENNLLTGTLPDAWSVFNKLKQINFSELSLKGGLPASWSAMTELIWMVGLFATLSGTLPESWGTLPKLEILDLGGNFMSGTLPATWSGLDSMAWLLLNANYFTGTLPAAWSTLDTLVLFSVRENAMIGKIPSEYSTFSRRREVLDVSFNEFICGNMTLDTYAFRNVQDTVPLGTPCDSHQEQTLALLAFKEQITAGHSALQTWNLRSKYLVCDSGVEGDVAVSGGARGTYFPGTTSFAGITCEGTDVVSIDCSGMNLTGQLVPDFSALTAVTLINVDDNSFQGTLPSEWSTLSNLNVITANNNDIDGSLPTEWSAMRAITRMELADNAGLNESIPPTWTVVPSFARRPPAPLSPPPPPPPPQPLQPGGDIDDNSEGGGGGGGEAVIIIIIAVIVALVAAMFALVLVLWLRGRRKASPQLPPPKAPTKNGMKNGMISGSESASTASPSDIELGSKISPDMSTSKSTNSNSSGTKSGPSLHDSAFTRNGDVRISAADELQVDMASAPHDVLDLNWDDIILGKRLDRGNFKTVYEGMWGGNEVAVATHLPHALIGREVNIMARLSKHPNLVQLYGISRNPENSDEVNLVMQLVKFGSLLQVAHAGKLIWTNVAKITAALQICLGMEALNREGVVHADLAARNVFVQSINPVHVKVGDFGMSKLSTVYYGATSKIPFRWAAPEVLLRGKWTEKSDVWSFGVTLWEMYTNCCIPYGLTMSNDDIVSLVSSGGTLERPDNHGHSYGEDHGHSCPDNMWALIRACWGEHEDERPTFMDLRKRLQGILAEEGGDPFPSKGYEEGGDRWYGEISTIEGPSGNYDWERAARTDHRRNTGAGDGAHAAVMAPASEVPRLGSTQVPRLGEVPVTDVPRLGSPKVPRLGER